jgi:hypothetical protein
MLAAVFVLGGLLVSSPARAAEPTVPGAFVSLDPARLLDTRDGIGAAQRAVAPRETLRLQVTGRAGIPQTGVAAVVMNVTAVSPAAAGFVTVFPSGSAPPMASNLNFRAGDVIANLVTVRVGDTGAVDLANDSSGTVHLLADVSGYYLSGTPTAPGTFVSLDPSRVLDTRVALGADGPAGPNGTLSVQVGGRGGVPASGVSAVVMNVTVTRPTSAGFLTVYPSGTSQPFASNLNFDAGLTVPNLVTVAVGAGGKVDLTNSAAGTTDLIADVAGYYVGGTPTLPGTFVSVDPVRLFDSRGDSPNFYILFPDPSAPSGSGTTIVTGHAGIPASGVSSVVLNVTAVPRARFSQPVSGFVTVFPFGTARPLASNLNYSGTRAVPNLVTVRVGANGQVSFIHQGTFLVYLIGDVAGYYLSEPIGCPDTRGGPC